MDAERSSGSAASLHWAQRALAMSALDERAVRRAIELHDRLGDGPGAIRTYDRFAAAMRDDYSGAPESA